MTDTEDAVSTSTARRRWELGVFLFLAFVLAPVLLVIIVGGYGFLIWMHQLVSGPPSM